MTKATTGMSILAAPLFAFGLAAPAFADSCEKSRDYILEGMAGDLAQPGRVYRDLFKVCQEVLSFSNVKDAFVLKAGTIAIDPARNTPMATAATLAQFCERFPDRTLRFMTPAEQRAARTVGVVVMLPAGNPTWCKALRGAT